MDKNNKYFKVCKCKVYRMENQRHIVYHSTFYYPYNWSYRVSSCMKALNRHKLKSGSLTMFLIQVTLQLHTLRLIFFSWGMLQLSCRGGSLGISKVLSSHSPETNMYFQQHLIFVTNGLDNQSKSTSASFSVLHKNITRL